MINTEYENTIQERKNREDFFAAGLLYLLENQIDQVVIQQPVKNILGDSILGEFRDIQKRLRRVYTMILKEEKCQRQS